MSEANSEIEDLNTRLSVAEHSIARMKEAFPQNSLKLPDYDGHRVAHERAIESAKIVDKYKFSATNRVIGWVVMGLLGFVASGFAAKVGGIFK